MPDASPIHRKQKLAARVARLPVLAHRGRWYRALWRVMLAAITPLLEKNVIKTLSLDVPLVFSMSRLVVLAFATGMMRQLWKGGIAGWPEAMLAIAIVLALPLLGALERVPPDTVVDLAKVLIGRFGTGAVREAASAYSADDHAPSALPITGATGDDAHGEV